MVNLRSISARAIVAISLIIAATCGILGAFSVSQERSLTRLALDRQLRLQYDSVITALDYEARTALAVSSVIANLPPVRDAIINGDRDALFALLSGPLAALKKQGISIVDFMVPPATSFFRVHLPKVFGDDASARRPSAVLANQNGQPVSGVEMGRDALGVFGMTPIPRDGKSIAVSDIGIPFGKEFVDRARQRAGVDLAVHGFDGKGFVTLASTFGDAVAATPEEVTRAFAGPPLRRDATFAGHPAALYVGQIKNFAGQPVAVLEVVMDTTEYEAAAAAARGQLILGTMAILLLGMFLALLLGRGMTRPLAAITATMNRLSGGDTGVAVPGTSRRDEFGVMANAVLVFRDNMTETARLKAEQDLDKHRAGVERHRAMLALATTFETGIGGVVAGVASAAGELQATARTMAATSEETTRRASTVAEASIEATTSAETVAAAAEELSTSIQEIGTLVTRSGDVTRDAVRQAHQSNEQMGGLTAAADRIGEVVVTISAIAGQTNLLALNATIEAARAGDAGKGFAVVASEVKALASQTAKATEQIGVQIKAIQDASRASARAIEGITETIGRVNETAAAIAAAVEEQGAAAREIARNVARAAGATREVTSNIAGVNQAAGETGEAAARVLTASEALSTNGDLLRGRLQEFLRGVRAA